MQKLIYLTLISIIVLCGCKKDKSKRSYENLINSTWNKKELEQTDFIIIIPHQGCSGCITYAEDFYLRYKYNRNIKFIFTHIISFKNLKNRLKINMNNTLIDRDNNWLMIGEPDKKIYPCILQIKNDKVIDIRYQSPYEDGFSLVEKYIK